MSDVDPVEAFAAELYGVDGTGRAEGIVHVVAVWESPDGWEVMRINEATPRSEADLFALMLARARADVIVTTGAILRAEPSLRYDLQGPMADALARWRRAHGRPSPPTVVVLTRSGRIDPAHPSLHSWATPVVFTSETGAAGAPASVEVVARADPSLRAAIAWARDEREARLVSIEAGPSTAADLYDPPVAVDELMLSVFAGPSLPAQVRGRPFVVRGPEAVPLPESTAPRRRDEPSGPWIFRRFFRDGTGNKPIGAGVR